MYLFKGFVAIDTLISNVPNVTAPIGEISTYSMTFSRDKLVYNNAVNRALTIYSFNSNSSITGNLPVPTVIQNKGFEILNWIYNRQINRNVVETKDDFLTALINQFLPTCDNLSIGDLVLAVDGHQFPEYITWKNRDYTTENNLNKVWFSDSAFRQQYDSYEIVVVPPIDVVEAFYQSSSQVATLINSRSYSRTLEKIQIARNNSPETILAAMSYDYVDPLNANTIIPTNWSVLIYGPAGNNTDVLKQSIRDYILSNSIHTAEEWKIRLPDIFKRTEFVLFPRWFNYAIPNLNLQSGIYSPIINLTKEILYIQDVLPDYPVSHIEAHATVMPNPYKCLAITVIGGFENRGDLFEITQIYPDILNVSTTSVDFNRMSTNTKGLLNLISNMLPIAEVMTEFSDIPIGFRKVKRFNVLYLATTYLNFEYLIASKLSTPDYIDRSLE